jgi:hypothetical protein
LCDRKAWDALEAHNKSFFEKVEKGEIRLEHEREFFTGFIGGTFGPNYNYRALEGTVGMTSVNSHWKWQTISS